MIVFSARVIIEHFVRNIDKLQLCILLLYCNIMTSFSSGEKKGFCFHKICKLPIICCNKGKRLKVVDYIDFKYLPVFPAGCSFYNAPHSPSCIRSIWEEGGCTREGYGYYHNLTVVELQTWNLFDIR